MRLSLERVRLSPGVKLPNVPLETSLTIVAVYRDGAIYADSVRPSPPGFGPFAAEP